MNWIAVFVGGGLGSLCRFGIAQLGKELNWELPWATFISNIAACLLLAVVSIQLNQKMGDQSFWTALLIVGFCGGFSTFSTYSFETAMLIKSGHWPWAIGNVLISTISGLAIIWYILWQK